MTECIVCKQVTNKYKCPKCLGQYCSVNCYKEHKESPLCFEAHNDKPKDAKEYPFEYEPTVHEPFKTEDTVPQDKLKELGLSDDLKTLLYNPHLRHLLREIDTASNVWKAIRAAMYEPLFLEFAEVCLKIIEPSTEDDNF